MSFEEPLTSNAFFWKIKRSYLPFLSVRCFDSVDFTVSICVLILFTFMELITFKSKANAEVIDGLILWVA